MTVSIHQPAYLPWLGYFDRIMRSDVFVYLETVQFEKNSFINRNRIRDASNEFWLTVPVALKGHLQKRICEIEISGQAWKRKHLKSIQQSYQKTAQFTRCNAMISALYTHSHTLLTELLFEHLQFWLTALNIDCEVVRSRDLPCTGTKSDLILNICKHLGADRYLSGVHGRDYLDSEEFSANGVEVVDHAFRHPEYDQVHGDFVEGLGIVDFWFNHPDRPIAELLGVRATETPDPLP